MKRSVIVAFVSFLVFLLFGYLFGFSTTGLATLFIQQHSGTLNYKAEGAENFVQCLDGEPNNDIFQTGICFTQLHKGSELYGINSVDYCKSDYEVVDYYCSSSMVCTEVISECGDGFVCDGGKCVKKFTPYRYFDIRNLGRSFKNLFVRVY